MDPSLYHYSWNFGLGRNLNEAEIAEIVGLLDKLEGARLFHSRTVHVQSSSLQIVWTLYSSDTCRKFYRQRLIVHCFGYSLVGRDGNFMC